MKRSLILILALLLACGGLSACGQTAGAAIRVDMAAGAENLDPQLATGDTAVTVLANCFEGLLRQNAAGSLSPAGAESYTLSPDGKTYTFTLRADARWSDGVPVTASDYRFAFQRIFDPEYLSPYAQRFASIAGAQERIALAQAVQARRDADAAAAAEQPPAETEEPLPLLPETEEPPQTEPAAPTEAELTAMVAALPALGVRVSGDDTLILTLTQRNGSFLERLATTPAAPCREDFFTASRARYGCSADYLLANGSFQVAEWSDTEIRLTPNTAHYDYAETMPASVRLYIGQADPAGRFFAGSTDFCALPHEQLAAAEKEGFPLISRGNQLWALVFNQNRQPTANAEMRRALAAGVDLAAYAEAGRIPQRYGAAQSLLLTGEGETPAAYAADRRAQAALYDPAAARAACAAAQADPETAQQTAALSLILPQSAGLEDLAGYLQRGWIDTLNLYVNVYALPEAEYRQRLLSGDYDIAFQLLSAPGDGAAGTLSAFRTGDSANSCGYASAAFDAALEAAASANSAEDAAGHYARAAALLREDAAALPVLTQSSYCALGENVSGITLLPDGTLLLRDAQRK